MKLTKENEHRVVRNIEKLADACKFDAMLTVGIYKLDDLESVAQVCYIPTNTNYLTVMCNILLDNPDFAMAIHQAMEMKRLMENFSTENILKH